jgi:hypothetical protein
MVDITGEVELDPSAEYKLVVISDRNNILLWEDGENRSLSTDDANLLNASVQTFRETMPGDSTPDAIIPNPVRSSPSS